MKKGILLSIFISTMSLCGEQEPFKYTMINKTEVPVQIIQTFKGWCGLNIMDLSAKQTNDLNTPCKMTRINFAIDKKLLTCPIDDECKSKDNCWSSDDSSLMEPGIWIIEQYKSGQVPQINKPKNFSTCFIKRIELPATPAGIVYVITRFSEKNCLYDLAK